MSPPGSLTADVAKILAAFREAHGWQPGEVWDPYTGRYTWPDRGQR